ncbi:STM4015 family protein [Actinomadura roseirufa]|uniref:STM4015 family protein n=1 Tax=Actinomadura roseirufa TaxID=2094049 RepID=UPI001F5EBF22|nr:STM4015 family protein [Actinomadura roseirufa]
MSVHDRLTEFAGLPVRAAGPGADGTPPPGPGDVAWGIYDREQGASPEKLDWLPEGVDTTRITHLVLGFWDYDGGAVESLVAAADRFTNLRALFLGDILDWELHISWIKHGDITPLFEAYPGLEHLEIRGASDLRFEPPRSDRLRVLRIESGGLPTEVATAVAAAELPALEHLDLWIGSDWYDGTSAPGDYAPILTGERLPALRHLGLENGGFQDELAEALATAPVVARLESLSLALGMLSDRGAEALLTGQPLTHLRRLDLHHHYLAEAMADRVKAALPGVEVDLTDPRGEADWVGRDLVFSATYIAVSE